jgi:hypothetical protein
MQGITKIEFYLYQSTLQLARQFPKRVFCFCGGQAEFNLFFETLSGFHPQPGQGRAINGVIQTHCALGCPHFFLWRTMHPDQNPGNVFTLTIKTRCDKIADPSPTAQIEISDAKICTVSLRQCQT